MNGVLDLVMQGVGVSLLGGIFWQIAHVRGVLVTFMHEARRRLAALERALNLGDGGQ